MRLPSFSSWIPHTDSGAKGVLRESYFTIKRYLNKGVLKTKYQHFSIYDIMLSINDKIVAKYFLKENGK